MSSIRTRPLILDAGGLFAFERMDRRVVRLLELADELHIAAGVVGQVWRNPARQVRGHRRCGGCLGRTCYPPACWRRRSPAIQPIGSSTPPPSMGCSLWSSPSMFEHGVRLVIGDRGMRQHRHPPRAHHSGGALMERSLNGERPCTGHAAICSSPVLRAIIGPIHVPMRVVAWSTTGLPQTGHSPFGGNGRDLHRVHHNQRHGLAIGSHSRAA